MSDQHGTVIWSELMTRDVAAAKAFYGPLCGWTFSEVESSGGGYHVGLRNGRPVVGILDISSPQMAGAPNRWFTYLGVDDVEAAAKATVAAGGKIIKDVFEVPGTGRIAIVEDSTGAMLGLMTPAPADG